MKTSCLIITLLSFWLHYHWLFLTRGYFSIAKECLEVKDSSNSWVRWKPVRLNSRIFSCSRAPDLYSQRFKRWSAGSCLQINFTSSIALSSFNMQKKRWLYNIFIVNLNLFLLWRIAENHLGPRSVSKSGWFVSFKDKYKLNFIDPCGEIWLQWCHTINTFTST